MYLEYPFFKHYNILLDKGIFGKYANNSPESQPDKETERNIYLHIFKSKYIFLESGYII